MSVMPDKHECRWKELYETEAQAFEDYRNLVADYLTLSKEEFSKKHASPSEKYKEALKKEIKNG